MGSWQNNTKPRFYTIALVVKDYPGRPKFRRATQKATPLLPWLDRLIESCERKTSNPHPLAFGQLFLTAQFPPGNGRLEAPFQGDGRQERRYRATF